MSAALDLLMCLLNIWRAGVGPKRGSSTSFRRRSVRCCYLLRIGAVSPTAGDGSRGCAESAEVSHSYVARARDFYGARLKLPDYIEILFPMVSLWSCTGCMVNQIVTLRYVNVVNVYVFGLD